MHRGRYTILISIHTLLTTAYFAANGLLQSESLLFMLI